MGPGTARCASRAQFAVLEGDPTASTGDYTIRLKMPDGFRIAPHCHPERENVTVISGTFKLGMGDEFETDKMKAFTAGSFAFLDPRHAPLRHGLWRNDRAGPRAISLTVQLRQSRRRPEQK